jgi:hypothetical protein
MGVVTGLKPLLNVVSAVGPEGVVELCRGVVGIGPNVCRGAG